MLTKVSIGCPCRSLSPRACPGVTDSLPEPLSISMFASRGISHANKITTFHCLLCKTPSLRKETRVCFWNKTVYRWNVPKQVLRKPRDNLSLRPSRTAGIVLNCRKMFKTAALASPPMASERLPICSTYESNWSISRLGSRAESSGSASIITTAQGEGAGGHLWTHIAEPQ